MFTVASSDSYPSSSMVPAKKSSQPSKLVDLGAAASFASQQQQQQQPLATSTTVSEPSDSTGAQGDLINIFGTFSSAPAAKQPVQQAQDKGNLFDSDFADFQGAFSSQQVPQASQPTHNTGILHTGVCLCVCVCVTHVRIYTH